ncbi:MAG: UDP-2,3-diacylglucosamine diphosphatase LpxI [Rhodospirillales bacterium]|nr:UDP-2,3-diacylglucosamine diphosphatase LpxI [Rhodospirillales bacterium]
MAPKLGIVAGGGELPARLVGACRASGRDVFVLAIEGNAEPGSLDGVPHAWIRLGEAAEGFRLLRQAGVDEVVMAGRIRRPTLKDLRPDWRTARFFARLGWSALGDDGLLRAVIREFEEEGFRVVGVQSVLNDLLAVEGVYGRHQLDEQAWSDIRRGVAVARGLGALDVGQAVVVQQGIVLGVEAVEGTDALLQRCAGLRRAGVGGVLVKTAKPGQERRVDLPTIGVETVRQAAAAGLRGIAVTAGSSLMVEGEAVVAEADALGLFVVGVSDET